MKTDFYSLSKDALAGILADAGFPKFRAAQVFDAVYKHKVFSPAGFPSIPKNLKEWLAENFEFAAGKLVEQRHHFLVGQQAFFVIDWGREITH